MSEEYNKEGEMIKEVKDYLGTVLSRGYILSYLSL